VFKNSNVLGKAKVRMQRWLLPGFQSLDLHEIYMHFVRLEKINRFEKCFSFSSHSETKDTEVKYPDNTVAYAS
jgi:hypothetical protein